MLPACRKIATHNFFAVSPISPSPRTFLESSSPCRHEHDRVRAVVWREDALELLDQRLLPGTVRYRRLTSAADVAQAIHDMVVRGAPAIGIAAAYGVVLAARIRHAEAPDRWRTLDR
ncbi:MAG: hypothetical protein MZU84_05495 [Sphingobacterium sp.]|nr:hypothetical protein [Sphingobacterium sp.]